MTTIDPLFDPEIVDTPVGLAPALALASITGVPAKGSGLSGAVYVPGTSISSLAALQEVIATQAPDLTFTATEILYNGTHSGTTVAEFLGDDAASLDGDGNAFEMGPSGLSFTGYIFIPAGEHSISVTSDDGFALQIGGIDFTHFSGTRSEGETTRLADFDGGLYQIDLIYFDAWSRQNLSIEIDGLPVDESAFYQSVADFQNPDPGTPIVPVDEYHPSHFLGADSLDDPEVLPGTEDHDLIEGHGGDDTIDGLGGDDILYGGYGDDSIDGGAGDDLIDGGRGSDLLIGGDGDDLLVSRSDSGEQRIGQLAIGEPTRGDPDGEVNEARQKLFGYEGQPLIGDDVMVGGAGRDTFLIAPQINAKHDIIQKHVRDDGTIKWSGVAGENNEVHDHWVDSNGIDVIADYNADEDLIAVIGHTANVYVAYRDTDNDGDDESIVTIISQQGAGGGAHTFDLIGQLIVHGDKVLADDIVTDAGVTYGIVQTYGEVAEALYPTGDLKQTVIDGEIVYGYDTREPGDVLGPVTGNPEDHVDNPYLAGVTFANPTEPGPELTRYPFEQLGFEAAAGVTVSGGPGDDVIGPDVPAEAGLPGALGYWSFADGHDGAFADARGGPSVKAYTLWENQAILRTGGLTEGPGGTANAALSFNGEDEFAFLAHDPAYQVTQGTIAMWVRPDDVSDHSIFLSKDERNAGDGGHFRLGHKDDGALFMRFATGDGGSNRAWKTVLPVLADGAWSHIAVSFTDSGVTVYVDGAAVPDFFWTNVEGNVETPGVFTEAYLLNNQEPWVLGADTSGTDENDTAAQFATDDEDLDDAFEGAIAQVGIWGGFTADDALDAGEVADLFANGPGAALTNPSGPQPMTAGDDDLSGGAGNDVISGGAGDDTLDGGEGHDSLDGGYGDDLLDGGAGNDTLDGGRGSDLLIGGDGNDILISRSDAGEQRAGQLVLGEPSRDFPDPSISNEYLKLIDWIDQPLIADDVLVGGAGNDLFYFAPVINAKLDIIMEHVNEDRTINWTAVAGENDRIHDHWVDHLGIDIIADYNADEDTIAIVGHTANVEVTYKLTDTDADGVSDSIVSIITVYSQQGANGGAHDEDSLAHIVVHGDLVNEDSIITNPGVTFGIVDTIDDLQDALAPTGETKMSTGPNGEQLFGYDSRDVDGNPIGTDPEAYSSNPWLLQGLVEFADSIPDDLAPLQIVMEHEGGSFDGETALTIPHISGQAQETGTWAFSFTADSPGGTSQALLSKDHTNFGDGGHLTFWINEGGFLKVRIQSGDHSYYLAHYDDEIVPGEEYHVAFTFDGEELLLYVNGRLTDAEEGFPGGMLGNIEDAVLGASTMHRNGDNDNLNMFFNGMIGDVLTLDRPLAPVEALLLAEAGGDPAAIVHDGDPAEDDLTGPVITASDGNLTEGETATGLAVSADDPSGPVSLTVTAGDYTIDGGALVRTAPADYDEDAGGVQTEVVELTATDGLGNTTTASVTVTIENDPSDDGVVGPPDIVGTEENDNLTGTSEGELIDGLGGNDVLVGLGGDDTLRGGDGNDYIVGGLGADRGEGGAGDDRYLLDDAGDQVVEEAGNGTDTIISKVSYALPDHVERLKLAPTGGDIDATGNALDNRLIGNDGANVLDGGEGNDLLLGGGGADDLDGGSGNDALNGGLGADAMEGGTGDDRYVVDNIGDTVIEAAGAGMDAVVAHVSYTLGDNVERLALARTSGDIDATGNALDNRVTGSNGANRLDGGGGNDLVVGRDGDDTLDGGSGNDMLRGDDGADGFYFDLFGTGNSDRIVDFELGTDSVVLLGSAFGITAAGFAAAFATGDAAADANDRIVYDSVGGRLYYDADGSGAGDAEMIAQLGRGIELGVGDFDIV